MLNLERDIGREIMDRVKKRVNRERKEAEEAGICVFVLLFTHNVY